MIRKRPKLKIVVDQAKHFFRWELPYLEKNFELVDQPSEDALLYAFGPDVFFESAQLPALKRICYLFPGFGTNPYHNLNYRSQALECIENLYDRVFINPGPLEVAYKSSKKLTICPFTIDTELVTFKNYRSNINSLVHISNPAPQKDWKRSLQVMENTTLKHKVFPKRRNGHCIGYDALFKIKLNNLFSRLDLPIEIKISSLKRNGYVKHTRVIKEYQKYDGFVHVAQEFNNSLYIDGKYTACLLEAALTGAIIFWYDTFSLGNDFETFFSLPLDPKAAAEEILYIRKNLDVEQHSKLTREEALDKCNPEVSMKIRIDAIKELI